MKRPVPLFAVYSALICSLLAVSNHRGWQLLPRVGSRAPQHGASSLHHK